MDLVNSDASLGTEKSLRNVEDAYLTAVLPVGNGLTINAGKLVTHMGGEVIETIGNINYSRSILFAYAIPYYHLGLSANYPFSDKFNATLYIYNGWNDVVDNNKGKLSAQRLAGSQLLRLPLLKIISADRRKLIAQRNATSSIQ